MTSEGFFSSPLAEHFSAYVALRRSVGYELRSQVYLLRQFDQIVAQEMPVPGPITREVVAAYLRSLSHLQATTRRVRLCMLRQTLLKLELWARGEKNGFAPSARRLPGSFVTTFESAALARMTSRYSSAYAANRSLVSAF